MWRHCFWFAALALAPIIYGAVDPGGQAVAGIFLGLSWLFLASEISARNPRILPTSFAVLILLFAALYLIPLPANMLKALSPERFHMTQRFALESSETKWIYLTSSFAESIQRFWELALVVAAFHIARQAIKNSRLAAWLVGVLTGAVVLLAAAEAFRRWDGRSLWRSASTAAGSTFANRDHFANWMCVCVLFLLGWVLRCFWPLQSFRPTRVHRRPWIGAVMLTILAVGLVAVMSSGSRGAFLALLAGVVVWAVLLATQTHSQKRMAAIVLVAVAGCALLLLSSDLLLKRLADSGSAMGIKKALAQDALKMFPSYRLFGIGPGAFERVYPITKSLFPGSAVLHVENEWVEQLLEMGLAGAGILLAALFFAFRHFASLFKRRGPDRESRRAKRECLEPELLFGAIAALAGFFAHSLFEFVFHISANAILAATFFGIVAGLADSSTNPSSIAPAPPSRFRTSLHWMGGVALLLVASLQGLALLHWQKAESAASPTQRLHEVTSSSRLWPFDAHRVIVMVRAEILANQNLRPAMQAEAARSLDRTLTRAIARDELNWELRLEKCMVDIQFSTNRAACYREALQVMQLNPLQPALPLQLASAFGRRYSSEALAILREAKFSSEDWFRDAFTIAWQINPDTETLWSLTPNTPAGLLALGSFASHHNLRPLAVQAYQAAKGRVKNLTLAEAFLDLNRPDLAFALISNPPAGNAEKLIAARAYFVARSFSESIEYSESILKKAEDINFAARPVTVKAPIPAENPSNQADAERLAGTLSALDSQSEVDRIQELHRLFPKSKTIHWFLFQSQRQVRAYESAARTGLELAEAVVNDR